MGKDTTNLSKLKREKLLTAIKEIKEGITDPDKITALNEIENELLEMKYGLKWEKHEEQVDRDLLTKIPVFKEDKEREIVKTEGEFNFLLEGDNLHSLMLLEKTHRNAIDVIAIDVPYNTGNRDFKYGDNMIDTKDDFRHSKWLSFMERRLRIAYELLTDKGVVFINIDDNEMANLKLLCDDIFGEINQLTPFVWLKGNAQNDAMNIQKNHEYILVYKKGNPVLAESQGKQHELFEDEYGFFIKGAGITTGGAGGTLNKRKNLGYSIYFNRQTSHKIGICDYDIELALTENDENKVYKTRTDLLNKGYECIRPPKKGNLLGCWTWSIEKFNKDEHLILITDSNSVIKKEYIKIKDEEIIKKKNKKYIELTKLVPAKSVINISSSNGTKRIVEMFNDKKFNNSKPVELITHIAGLHPNKNATILDFFAGSGTTGHAVLELNKEDGGNRKFILCTNNEVGEAKEKEFKKLLGDKEDHPEEWANWEDEHGIARSVTYKRLEKVINGYTTPKGKEIEDTPANLKYYKTEYIPREMEDDDYDAHDEINKYIIELIQLEFAIDIHNPKIGLVLSDEYMESENFNVKEIDDKKLNEVEDIYIAEGLILPDGLQEKISKRGIRLHWVPQYYKF